MVLNHYFKYNLLVNNIINNFVYKLIPSESTNDGMLTFVITPHKVFGKSFFQENIALKMKYRLIAYRFH